MTIGLSSSVWQLEEEEQEGIRTGDNHKHTDDHDLWMGVKDSRLEPHVCGWNQDDYLTTVHGAQ